MVVVVRAAVDALVAAEDSVALPRLMERNSFSEDEATQRLSSQRNWKDRAAASDLIFHNNDEVMVTCHSWSHFSFMLNIFIQAKMSDIPMFKV